MITSRLTEEVRLAHEKYHELINNYATNQFGGLLIEDEESILDYAAEFIIDFYNMKLYSGLCQESAISELREDTQAAYKKM